MSDNILDFWQDFGNSEVQQTLSQFGKFRTVHSTNSYVEFENEIGLGFRPRAVALLPSNLLRAELLSSSKAGIEFVEGLLASDCATISTRNGTAAVLYITPKKNHARIHLEWKEAATTDRAFWPAHHLWIAISIGELVTALAAANR